MEVNHVACAGQLVRDGGEPLTLQPESQEITREIVLRLPERCQQIFRILGLFYFAAANDFIASARFLYAHSADGFNAMARSK